MQVPISKNVLVGAIEECYEKGLTKEATAKIVDKLVEALVAQELSKRK